jgi:hypothetical protein
MGADCIADGSCPHLYLLKPIVASASWEVAVEQHKQAMVCTGYVAQQQLQTGSSSNIRSTLMSACDAEHLVHLARTPW